MAQLLMAMVGGGLCGSLTAAVGLGLLYTLKKPAGSAADAPVPAAPPPKVIKLGAAAPGAVRLDPPTLPTEPGLALDVDTVQAAAESAADDTWDDGDPLTQVRRVPEHVVLEDLTGKVVLTSGAGVLMEDGAGRREWTTPQLRADVAPTIWIDVWGPLSPEDLVVFAQNYRQVERVHHDAPERLPTLLQELGYRDVGEWFQVYYTFLKHFGVGGPGDAIADYAFGQDFKDALFAADS